MALSRARRLLPVGSIFCRAEEVSSAYRQPGQSHEPVMPAKAGTGAGITALYAAPEFPRAGMTLKKRRRRHTRSPRLPARNWCAPYDGRRRSVGYNSDPAGHHGMWTVGRLNRGLRMSSQATAGSNYRSIAALFIAFLTVSLCGFGGGLSGRIASPSNDAAGQASRNSPTSLVFANSCPVQIWSASRCVGAKLRGCIGAAAALCGFIAIPWGIGFSLGALFLEYAHLTVVRNVLGGV
jgi:hypothetical protein